MHVSFLYLAFFFAALAICGLGYQFLVIAGIVKFRRLTKPQPPSNGKVLEWDTLSETATLPPISILKPLCGADPRMYEAFRSHYLQDYPEFEIIFGVADADDLAVAEVERLQREFPSRRIQLVVCPEPLGTNRKISTLVQLLAAARYDLLLINDSDIIVPPDYLRQIAETFAAAESHAGRQDSGRQTGMVTAMYRATAGSTIPSRLEALTITTDFGGAVLSAYALEGRLTFGLGSTLAVRREALEAIGGLRPLLDFLADDYELGNRIAHAGFKVMLAPVVVETALPDESFGEMFRHQLRWARTIRDRRLRGYIGLGVTHVVPWALLACLCSGLAAWSLVLLATSALLRFAVAAALCHSVLQDTQADLDLWMLPLRDVVAVLVWIISFTGNTVEWRGERFRLHAGKLQKL